jgi:hypothetical protein
MRHQMHSGKRTDAIGNQTLDRLASNAMRQTTALLCHRLFLVIY